MKVLIRTYKDDTFTEKEVANLTTAQAEKKVGEKIHICYHDEKDIKACRLE